MYWLEILEITPRNHFALFKRNDDEYGWLEVHSGEVSVGDILRETKNKDFTKCGPMQCVSGSQKLRIHINDFGFESDMRKAVQEWDQRF